MGRRAAHKLLAQVVDEDLAHAEPRAFFRAGAEGLSALPDVGMRSHLAAVGILQPFEDEGAPESGALLHLCSSFSPFVFALLMCRAGEIRSAFWVCNLFSASPRTPRFAGRR